MASDKAISEHYLHGDLLQVIQASLGELGKTIDSVTIEDLAPVDEFHVGGRIATEHLLAQLGFSEQHHILDVGCGLGGAARFVASKYNAHVTGIDLTEEYIETGKSLCSWVKLDNKITLQQGNAVALPFTDESFDGSYMLHVGMNIADKGLLFRELYRVLRPRSSLGVYDVMRVNEGDLAYPLPWAEEKSISHLAAPEEYKQALIDAGFQVFKEMQLREFALDFYQKIREKAKARGGPPPLGLHTLLKGNAAIKIKNTVDNITANYIAPVEIIAHKS